MFNASKILLQHFFVKAQNTTICLRISFPFMSFPVCKFCSFAFYLTILESLFTVQLCRVCININSAFIKKLGGDQRENAIFFFSFSKLNNRGINPKSSFHFHFSVRTFEQKDVLSQRFFAQSYDVLSTFSYQQFISF